MAVCKNGSFNDLDNQVLFYVTVFLGLVVLALYYMMYVRGVHTPLWGIFEFYHTAFLMISFITAVSFIGLTIDTTTTPGVETEYVIGTLLFFAGAIGWPLAALHNAGSVPPTSGYMVFAVILTAAGSILFLLSITKEHDDCDRSDLALGTAVIVAFHHSVIDVIWSIDQMLKW